MTGRASSQPQRAALLTGRELSEWKARVGRAGRGGAAPGKFRGEERGSESQ